MLRAHRVKCVSVHMSFTCGVLTGILVKQADLFILHVFRSKLFCSGAPTKETLSISTPK